MWRITRWRQRASWAPWPTGQFFAFAAFRFPVPKNEFVDLMLRGNDLPIDEAQALYEDAAARGALAHHRHAAHGARRAGQRRTGDCG